MENDKLYVVVRRDLPVGLRCAQICHAALKFAHEWRTIETAWYHGSNNIVILEVEDQAELLVMIERLRNGGISLSVFEEPDLNNEITAIAVEPKAKRLLRRVRLACAA
jgi:peptidyl-tRNA hydrolase